MKTIAKTVRSQACIRSIALAAALTLFQSVAWPFGSPYFILHEFEGGYLPAHDGGNPNAKMTLIGSTLYGTTRSGGDSDDGTVFKINTNGGGYAKLHDFDGSDGMYPSAPFARIGATLYGAAEDGGDFSHGTLFKIDLSGANFGVLHHFDGSDGDIIDGGMTLVGGKLLGAASLGGTNNAGTLYSFDPGSDDLEVLRHFNFTGEGWFPQSTVVSDGSALFGTASFNGAVNGQQGAIYRANIDGSGITQLHGFTGPDGSWPFGDLTLSGSTLYGTTIYGGAEGRGTVFRVDVDGSNFQTLYNFTLSDGWTPYAGVTLVGNTLYGTTRYSGDYNDLHQGILFRLNTDGAGFKVLYKFAGLPNDGAQPYGDLVFDGSTLFGTTFYGGQYSGGTIFAYAVPEPASCQLMLAALAASVAPGRRRWTNTATV